jgi:hypothetical protein
MMRENLVAAFGTTESFHSRQKQEESDSTSSLLNPVLHRWKPASDIDWNRSMMVMRSCEYHSFSISKLVLILITPGWGNDS